MRILKYKLAVADKQYVTVPCIFKILTVQVQHGSPCIWAEVDEDGSLENVNVPIYTVSTGHTYDVSDLEYIGTYQLANGQFIGHVYYGESISLPEAKEDANVSM